MEGEYEKKLQQCVHHVVVVALGSAHLRWCWCHGDTPVTAAWPFTDCDLLAGEEVS